MWNMSTVISDTDARLNVAANVNRILEDRGMTQADLARLTGENAMAISRVCRGTNLANVGMLARIAEALECTVDELLKKSWKKVSRTA